MKSNQFRCPKCGGETKEVAAGIYCFKCDLLLDSTGQPIAPRSGVVTTRTPKPPAPPVGEFHVWAPILWLVAIILLGFISWISGLWVVGMPGWVVLICAAVYVHYDAKKYGIESHALLTLLLAIIGLPLHANELHKLRKAQQTGQVQILKPERVEARAPDATVKPQPPVSGEVAGERSDITKPTKFCRKCGAKIPRDSEFCEECGTRLIEGIPPQTAPESIVQRKRTSWKSITIGLLLVLLIAAWAVFPVLLRDPSPMLQLTSTGSGGRYALSLQNRSPWPIVVIGYWGFSPEITWSDNGPADHFTLIPFGAYTFEYTTYCPTEAIGIYCPVIETAPYVTFTGEVRLLYRTYQVSIRSTNYGG